MSQGRGWNRGAARGPDATQTTTRNAPERSVPGSSTRLGVLGQALNTLRFPTNT
jgi:hypothetical protein